MQRQFAFAIGLVVVLSAAALPSCVRATEPKTHHDSVIDTAKEPVVITELADRDKHVGEVVTLRGKLTHGKISYILDVNVVQQGEPIPRELDGKTVEVTGKLIKFFHDDQGGLTQLPSGTHYKIDLPRGAEGVKEVK